MNMLKSTGPRMAEPVRGLQRDVSPFTATLCAHVLTHHMMFIQLWAGHFAQKGPGRNSIKNFAEIQKYYTTKCEQELEIWNTQQECFCMKDDCVPTRAAWKPILLSSIQKCVSTTSLVLNFPLLFSLHWDFSMKPIKFQKSKSGVHIKIKKRD